MPGVSSRRGGAIASIGYLSAFSVFSICVATWAASNGDWVWAVLLLIVALISAPLIVMLQHAPSDGPGLGVPLHQRVAVAVGVWALVNAPIAYFFVERGMPWAPIGLALVTALVVYGVARAFRLPPEAERPARYSER